MGAHAASVTASATAADPLDAATPAVRVRDVSFQYPAHRARRRHLSDAKPAARRKALDQVNLTIAPGETVALLGPNGSGKSTLLKIIATLLKPDDGAVEIQGRADAARARRALGVVFQRPGLDALMTVRENLTDSARLYGLKNPVLRDAVERALGQAGLVDRQDDLVKTLSGGLARRADLCRALLHQPPIVLLDEPTTGLDPTARRAFLDLIDNQRAAANLTVLMTTHLTDEADRFDRVVFMHEGRIVADDTPANLRSAAGTSRLLVLDPQWKPLDDQGQIWQSRREGWLLKDADHVDLPAVAMTFAARNVPFTVTPPTLADAFEKLTGAALHPESEAMQ